MGRAGRKSGQATSLLITPKWTNIKDPDELKKRMASRKSAGPETSTQQAYQLSDKNRPTSFHTPSHLNESTSIDEAKSDTESATGSIAGLGLGFDEDFEEERADILAAVLGTDAEEARKGKHAEKRSSKSDAKKRKNLPDEIFDYIHLACCRRLFSLS